MFVPVIESLLDTDQYKFTMWQPMLHQFPGNQARYRFVCRNKPAFPLADLKREIDEQIDHLCSLRFSEEDLAYLASKRYLKSDFIDYLRIFHFQRRYLTIETQGDDLVIEAQGPQIHVMGFEIFVLSIVNELYFRRFDAERLMSEGQKILDAKIAQVQQFESAGQQLAHPFEFYDFGTRRRYSRQWAEHVVRSFAEHLPTTFRGTSNMYLAQKYNLAAIGTMAHEYLQTFQAVGVQLKNFQRAALEGWVQEFRGDLGIALTDVIGMDAFLRDFDLYFAKLFDGLRHDSGDPIEWGDKALAHYQQLRVDAHTKRLVFSDGLTMNRAFELYAHFADRVQCGFGIGTHLTNDVGVEPLNIVMKLIECNGQPVAKLSDSPGKTMCEDQTFLAYLRQVFGVEN